MTQREYDFENRLLEYATSIIRLVERMSNTRAANHVGGQLLRCGTSPLFNHGEAQAAESPDDFAHKMKGCLKELRESERALRLVEKAPLIGDPVTVKPLLRETDELIRIFVTSIRTVRNNRIREDNDSDYHV